MDRFEIMGLRKNQEVIIKYDVIPYLDVDDTCKTGINIIFKSPTHCPICGEPLVKKPLLKCANYACDSRKIGQIQNYIEKMGIANISIGIVTTLYKEGILKGIHDLYKLEDWKYKIVELPGLGAKSFSKIIDGINSRKEVYDYQLLGAIGIPTIAEKTFKRILNIYYLPELIEICNKNKVNKLTTIGGIQSKTAEKVIEGMTQNKNLIEFLCSKLKVKRDTRKYTIKVCFTKIRDEEFEKFLDEKGVMVLDNYSKEVDLVIVPRKGIESSKTEKALKDRAKGKKVEIITIEDAYRMFGYKK
jgi:NAD-dependent DNA ligase